jgi:long-chain acyl-CoA synthetase
LVIESLDGVAEVAVMGVHDDLSGEAVTALVVPAAGAPLTPDEVSAHCATRLARFKCPSSVRLVVALPHSTTGKVARGRLREVYGEQ